MRKVSDAGLGKGQMLRLKARSADKGSMVSAVHENRLSWRLVDVSVRAVRRSSSSR